MKILGLRLRGVNSPPRCLVKGMGKMDTARISIFPLVGALLYPGLQLSLHIFEPRYKALISDALVRDRRIGMIQPHNPDDGAPLYTIGCVGRIIDVEALEDGRYNIVLEGVSKFRIVRELEVDTPFRQVEAELLTESADQYLSAVERAILEKEAQAFADAQGFSVDWEAVERLDDVSLINGVAQAAPFDVASRQALLEATHITERCELLVQLMQFFSRNDPHGDVTLQ